MPATTSPFDYSQFDALLKQVLNQRLSPPQMEVAAAGMLNLLGTQNGKALDPCETEFHHNPDGFLQHYGKEDSRIGRNMGHFTLLGQNQDDILKYLMVLKSRYQT